MNDELNSGTGIPTLEFGLRTPDSRRKTKDSALITGATGFVGSHLAEALVARGYEVHCLVRRTSDLKWLRGLDVRLVYGSVTDEASLAEAVRGKDYVFHSAGLTKARNVAEFLKVNAGGTRNVVSACANHNPALRRFVYISSQAAAGPSRDGTPLTEDAPCRPVSLYGKSKHEGELAVAEYAPSLPVTIVRPSAVFGPRDRDIFVFFQLANYRIMPIMGPPNGRASLIHVRDLAKAIVLAAESGKAVGQTYFAANPEPCSMIETGRLIAEALGKRCVRLRVPVFVLSFAAQITHLVAALGRPLAALSPDKVTELRQPYWVCSTAKIAAHLGFAPQYSLAVGLRETARWYKENRWLR